MRKEVPVNIYVEDETYHKFKMKVIKEKISIKSKIEELMISYINEGDDINGI